MPRKNIFLVTSVVLREYLAPLLRREIDTLVLGCTHYPLLKRALRGIVGPEVALVDSAECCATAPMGSPCVCGPHASTD